MKIGPSREAPKPQMVLEPLSTLLTWVLCPPKRPVRAEARKEVRLGDADARVLCDQLFLALTHIGAALQQGRLWAENNPNRGATFGFTVPVAEAKRNGQ